MKKHSKDAQIRTDVSEDFIRSFEEGFQEGKTQALKDVNEIIEKEIKNCNDRLANLDLGKWTEEGEDRSKETLEYVLVLIESQLSNKKVGEE